MAVHISYGPRGLGGRGVLGPDVSAFIDKHGGEFLEEAEGGVLRLLLPSGARVVWPAAGAANVNLHEPPGDEKQRLEAQRHYHHRQLAEIETMFTSLKARCGGGCLDGKSADTLADLKAANRKHKAAIASIDAELAPLLAEQEAQLEKDRAIRAQQDAAILAHAAAAADAWRLDDETSE